jgi:hypothetical protein
MIHLLTIPDNPNLYSLSFLNGQLVIPFSGHGFVPY